jgi:BMFP domain-containing protein YqiC
MEAAMAMASTARAGQEAAETRLAELTTRLAALEARVAALETPAAAEGGGPGMIV